MPLPDHAIKLHGGCNCRAIRYRIDIPELIKRPTHPFSEGDVRFPLVAADHCNDCRKATGSIIPHWICVPASMLSVSLASAAPRTSNDTSSPSPHDVFLPSMTALREDSPESKDSSLRWYNSSPYRTRTFCGNCGTNLTYAIFPMVEGYPDIFDVVLGTLDRECLQDDYVKPERHLWWDCGLEWVKELTSGGPKIPRHPKSRPNEFAVWGKSDASGNGQ